MNAMKISIFLILATGFLMGCAGVGGVDRPSDDVIKNKVMTRYDNFAKSGGKACEE